MPSSLLLLKANRTAATYRNLWKDSNKQVARSNWLPRPALPYNKSRLSLLAPLPYPSTVFSIDRIFPSARPCIFNALESTRQPVQKYLDEYFSKIDMRVYWGTAREFAAELRQRCQKEGIL